MRCKCIIVDDEPPAIMVLEKYIKLLPNFEIAGVCKNAFEAHTLLLNEKIDLAFLDIQMPKLTGTQLIKSLQHPPKVIFTTAHKDFAIEAFELDAIDFLLKPISFERFLKAVNKLRELPVTETELNMGFRPFVFFRADRKMIKVFLEDIQYVECFKDYVVIHRVNEKPLRIKLTLGKVQSMLPENKFIRIHRSYLISIDKITAYTKTDIEIGSIEIPIGKSYTAALHKITSDNQDFLEGVDER
jgi:DNA-binding LytR/AlgR family response regulator